MATASVDQSLTRLITCPVCSEDFNDKTPRELSCPHVLCEDCIQNMIEETKLTSPADLNKILCPICNMPTVIQGGQAASLPLREIVEDMTSSSLSREPTLLWQTKIQTQTGRALAVGDIEFLDNNHIIVVTWREVFVYNEKGTEIPHYLSGVSQGMSDDSRLWGVSVNRDKSKVVFVENKGSSEGGVLHIYFKQHVDCSHTKYVVCKHPMFVSFTNTDDYLVSSYSDNKIYKYNQQGIQVMCLQMSGFIWGLCVDKKNRIIVCLGKEVCVYDENGTKILTLQKKDTKLNLRDVCVSLDDNILVCDYRRQTVLLFDKNGVFIKNLLTLNSKHWRISLYKSKYLAVCDGDGNLFVYKL